LINHWQQFLLASLSKLVIYWIVWSPGIKESDTGLAAPSQWDLVSDKQMMQEEQPLQVQYWQLRSNPTFVLSIFLWTHRRSLDHTPCITNHHPFLTCVSTELWNVC
jgi:hypothetical protein